ncbi:MAG: hypothetical protein KDD34_05320 [Bdellovibrionales bacterium]|nr:hypothetical protein [Bdellovibrionales bacterium]
MSVSTSRHGDIIEAIIDEYLKPQPSPREVEALMKKLNIEYSNDDLLNMTKILNAIKFEFDSKEIEVLDV